MTQDTLVTAPERLQTYLDNPDGKRLPFSCTLAVLKEGSDVGELLYWATMSLKAGAGVKLVIDPTYRLPKPSPNLLVNIMLNKEHKDWELATFEEREDVRIIPTQGITNADLEPLDNIESIAQTWQSLSNIEDNLVTVDLTALRQRDSVNSDGLLASGPFTFALVYRAIERFRNKPSMHSLLRLFGILNEVILRGGYKKGIITSACVDTSPYYQEYLKVPLVSLRGSHKKGVILTQPPNNVDQLCELVNYESLFLQKGLPDDTYANVCMGIMLKDRGTCLINRVNLGRIEDFSDIPHAFRKATREAIEVHQEWRQRQPERAKQWANLIDDNQVAIDVMGLSNLLRRFKIPYMTFIEALEGKVTNDLTAHNLVHFLSVGYKTSSLLADTLCDELGIPRMVRLHCVEPAQAHSYRTTDLEGYTTCRGIWPPFSQVVNRYSHSSQEPVQTYNHGAIESLTPDQHFRLCASWHKLMAEHGRVHAVSFDTWEQFDPQVFAKWYASPLETLYYNMSQDYNTRGFARKRFKAPELTCSSCAD